MRLALPSLLVVAAAALAAGGDPAPRTPRTPPADLVLTAARVLTLDDDAAPAARAVAIRDGVLVAVGDPADVARWRGPETAEVDLGDAVLAPALVDHHVHLFDLGWALLQDELAVRTTLDLSAARSLDEVAAAVRARSAELGAGEWVLGAGWSQGSWGTQALPDRAPLDDAAPERPVLLARVDGHAGWANRRALEIAGLLAAKTDPPAGAILRRPDGTPSGVLLERAVEPVLAAIPPPSDAEIVRAFRLGAEALAARGIVEVYDAGVLPVPGLVDLGADFGRYLELLRRADAASPLPLAVNLMLPAPSAAVDALLASPPPSWRLSPRLAVTHLKLFADGALGSRGAALSHPYADDPTTRGVARMSSAEIAALARRALDAGLGVATHAIGDAAVASTLDAYEWVLAERPELDPRRLRVEHFSYARESDFARAVRLGVVLSVQSNFNALPDEAPTFGAMRAGAANESRVYAWDRLERMGARLAEGSDDFTRPRPALADFVATLTRKYAIGASRPEAEARRLAWRMRSTWWPPAGPPVDPTLRPGAPADLVALSADPMTAPREALERIEVVAVVRGGRVVRPGPVSGG